MRMIGAVGALMRKKSLLAGCAATVRGMRNTDGNVGLIGGLALTVILMFAAMTLDYSRSLSAKSTLQAALDAAALAGAKVLQDDTATAQTVKDAARAVFDSFSGNLKVHGLTFTNFDAAADFANDKVTTTVDAKVSSIFSRIVPAAEFVAFTPKATVSYAYEKIELAMVLDVTGSMNKTPPGDVQPKIESLRQAAKTVVTTLMADSPAENAVRIAIAPFSASVNAGALANAVSTPNAASTCSWSWKWGWSCPDDTCVIERSSSSNDNDPSADKIPTMPQPSWGNYVCPNAPVVPLQGLSQQQTLLDTITAYVASGATAGHIGAAWGWYLLSPNWAGVLPPSSVPGPSNDKHTHKHVIFMTDGQFNTSYLGGPGASATQEDDSYAEFQSLCTKMKGQGKITIWTVGFDLGGLGTTRPRDELIACSGADHFFDAPTGADLKAAFSLIVKNMRSMRVAG